MVDEREETTEMVSKKEMEEMLEEETPLPRHKTEAVEEKVEEEEEEVEEEVLQKPPRGLNVGSLRDRLAAALLDGIVLCYLYFATLTVYNLIAFDTWFQWLPPRMFHIALFHTLFALLAFFYFFVSEGVFFATLGKFFAHLSVRNKNGEGASLLSIALRNILRPIDYLLCFYPTLALMEKTKNQLRFGDLLSGTVVMKHYGRSPQQIPISGNIASASLRLIAGSIDFVLSALWMGGLFLFLDPKRPVLSVLILSMLPIVYLLWHLIWEGFFQTTFGLWLFGCQLVREDGSPIGFSSAFLRAIFKIFDTNPLGWLTLFLSNKKQKPSDLAAATVVVHTKRELKAIVGLILSAILISVTWFQGLSNPRNFLTPFFNLNFLQITVQKKAPRIPPKEGTKKGLFLKNFKFLGLDKTERVDAIFKGGETFYISFEVVGFTMRDSEAWLQEDLSVRYPDNAMAFKQEKIVDFHQNLKNPEMPLEIVNTLTLPENATEGQYTVVLTIYDRLSSRQLTEQRRFKVAP